MFRMMHASPVRSESKTVCELICRCSSCCDTFVKHIGIRRTLSQVTVIQVVLRSSDYDVYCSVTNHPQLLG